MSHTLLLCSSKKRWHLGQNGRATTFAILTLIQSSRPVRLSTDPPRYKRLTFVYQPQDSHYVNSEQSLYPCAFHWVTSFNCRPTFRPSATTAMRPAQFAALRCPVRCRAYCTPNTTPTPSTLAATCPALPRVTRGRAKGFNSPCFGLERSHICVVTPSVMLSATSTVVSTLRSFVQKDSWQRPKILNMNTNRIRTPVQ